ncbi:MAG: MFS transporter, partial [Simkaniaceae bacterium]|nr:MFS transporter [Simkaniaceae bacterium]
MNPKNFYQTLLVLSPLVFTFAFALDIYIPAVPEMPKIFKTTHGMVQLTLSIFMLVCGFGQLFIGPLSDHFGRRKIVLASIAVFTLGSFACTLARSIEFLILARMLQALGACGMMVTAYAIVRDLFDGKENFKAYSYLNGSIAISPLIAPLFGGYLVYWFNWRATFLFLTILGIST